MAKGVFARTLEDWAKLARFAVGFGKLWRKALWANLFSGFSGFCQLWIPILSLWLIDRAIPERNTDLLVQLSLAMGAAALFSLLATYAEFYYSATFRERMGLQLELDLFEHVAHLPLAFFKEHDSGYVMSRIANDSQVAIQALTSLAVMGRSVLFLIGGTALLPWLHPALGLAILATVPIYAFLLLWFNQRVKRAFTLVQEHAALSSRELFESLSGMSEIKLYTGERHRKRRYANRLIKKARSRIGGQILTQLGGQAASMVMLGVTLVILIGGGLAVINGQLTIGALISMNAIAAFLLPAINQVVTSALNAQKSVSAIERLDELRAQKPEDRSAASRLVFQPQGSLHFDNVTFGYLPDRPVLRNASLTINAGEKVLLVGSSGVGKTTLVHLLLRFFEPQGGRVAIDQTPISDIPVQHLRRAVAMVSQDIFLFSDSVLNNLTLANPKASFQQIQEAAELANATSFIENLPDGYHTKVGERGARLSGGQRQRIAIARAFLRNAPILVLDEATSAVDAKMEIAIHQALCRVMKGRTTLIIAHHAETFASQVDRIVEIREGSIHETAPDRAPALLCRAT